MANAKTPGGESDMNFDELFAGEQKSAAKGQAGKENLEELEAFLDEFEKGLGDPKAGAPAEAAVAPEPAPSFAEPQQAEELVQGLLKEDELNLDVEGGAVPEPEVPEFEPHPLPSAPLDIPAFIHAAPAGNGKPVPAAAAGFSRIGFILALVLGGAALLIAIGAGWMALNATQAVQGIELRVGSAPGGAPDPRLAKLQTDVTALRKQVDDLARTVEGSLTDLQGRVATLEKVAGVVPPAKAAAPEASAAPPAPAKPEVPKVAVAPKPGSPAAPAAPAAPVAKPAVPAAEAAKPQPVKPVPDGAKGPTAGAAPTAPPAAESAKAPAAAATAPATAPQEEKAAAGKAAPNGAPAVTAPRSVSKAKSAPVPIGGWVVHLTSSDEKKRAQAQLDHARAKGLAARLTTGTVEGKSWYRVTVEGFARPEEARAFVGKQAQEAGFSAAWIAKK